MQYYDIQTIQDRIDTCEVCRKLLGALKTRCIDRSRSPSIQIIEKTSRLYYETAHQIDYLNHQTVGHNDHSESDNNKFYRQLKIVTSLQNSALQSLPHFPSGSNRRLPEHATGIRTADYQSKQQVTQTKDKIFRTQDNFFHLVPSAEVV